MYRSGGEECVTTGVSGARKRQKKKKKETITDLGRAIQLRETETENGKRDNRKTRQKRQETERNKLVFADGR